MHRFDSIHPVSLLSWFCAVIFITVLYNNPVITVLSLFCSLCFFSICAGSRALLRGLPFTLFFFVFITLTNPLFSHRGVTPLFFMGQNPVTLEAVFAGLSLAGTLTAVLYWCRGFSRCFTTDKLLCVSGRLLPRLSVFLSVTFRFLPLFTRKIREVRTAQRMIGAYSRNNIIENIKEGLAVFSAVITWSLEHAIETSDSMQARGYGLAGRTSYSLFKLRFSDAAALTECILLALLTVSGLYGTLFYFYPKIAKIPFSGFSPLSYAAFFVLCFSPVIFTIKEAVIWRFMKSRI